MRSQQDDYLSCDACSDGSGDISTASSNMFDLADEGEGILKDFGDSMPETFFDIESSDDAAQHSDDSKGGGVFSASSIDELALMRLLQNPSHRASLKKSEYNAILHGGTITPPRQTYDDDNDNDNDDDSDNNGVGAARGEWRSGVSWRKSDLNGHDDQQQRDNDINNHNESIVDNTQRPKSFISKLLSLRAFNRTRPIL